MLLNKGLDLYYKYSLLIAHSKYVTSVSEDCGNTLLIGLKLYYK
jgi:hypothetical protein